MKQLEQTVEEVEAENFDLVEELKRKEQKVQALVNQNTVLAQQMNSFRQAR